jgi:hypothetical protein
MQYIEGRKGGFDPHACMKDLDLDGIDAAFLSPSSGLFSGAITDPDLAWAMGRVYNRWLVDYCGLYPDRLFRRAMLRMQSIADAIEVRPFARKVLGMRGASCAPIRITIVWQGTRPMIRVGLKRRDSTSLSASTKVVPVACPPSALLASRAGVPGTSSRIPWR